MEWRVKEIEGWFTTSLKFFTLRLAAPLGAKSSSGAIQNQVLKITLTSFLSILRIELVGGRAVFNRLISHH